MFDKSYYKHDKDNFLKLSREKYFISLNHSTEIKNFIESIDRCNIVFWFCLIKSKKIKIIIFLMLDRYLKIILLERIKSDEAIFLIDNLSFNEVIKLANNFEKRLSYFRFGKGFVRNEETEY